MLPPGPGSTSSEELLTETAMVASVSEVGESGASLSDSESDDFCTITNLFDIRGYCHYDLPNAQFKITHDESKSQFAVELLSGPHIVLHVNFRIGQHAIVLNAASHGNWGGELRYDNPLHDGDHFHLHIHVHESHYDIELNGHSIGHFDHRFPYESVQALGVRGGIHVKKIEFSGFPFSQGWGNDFGSHDFGHGGFIGYGTDSYIAPQFPQNHPHARHWN